MQDESRTLGEGFTKPTAHIGLLPGVNALVPLEVRPVVKGFAVLKALFKGLLHSVAHIVVDQCCTLKEDFPTLTAFMGILPSMSMLVSQEV